MKILNSTGTEIKDPDLSLGYLINDKILIKKHDENIENPGKFHYEKVGNELPNGGQEVIQVWDEPKVTKIAPWNEYEDVLRYVLYTQDQLESLHTIELNKKAPERYKLAIDMADDETAVSELGALVDNAEKSSGYNENAVLDLASYTSSLETRIKELEKIVSKGSE